MKKFALLSPEFDAKFVTVADYARDPYNYEFDNFFHPLTLAPLRPKFASWYVDSIEGFVLKRGYGQHNAGWSDDLVHEMTRMVILATKEMKIFLPNRGMQILRFENVTAEQRLKAGTTQSYGLDIFCNLSPESDLYSEMHGTMAIEISTHDTIGAVKLREIIKHNLAVIEYKASRALLDKYSDEYLSGEKLHCLRADLKELVSGVLDVSVWNLPESIPDQPTATVQQVRRSPPDELPSASL